MYGSASVPCPSYFLARRSSVGVIYLRHGSFLRTGIACNSLLGILTTVELLDDAMDISVSSRRVRGLSSPASYSYISYLSGMGINAVNKTSPL